ncbi:hypothetical protein NAP1_07495 [Erythrobacter sp. NAP1]|uniref:winged helix DNA-binding protein n=1 Tax=Erythrobacter sp. NAP1 TaxID=237727 RepID=UPI0000686E97|nr:winged helix DNA-binding protein [Erythrobacter sp. NAP1]EAQ30605.1 hypothetical protein NAP1_07495 [Erythrobacter sp. NAP1]
MTEKRLAAEHLLPHLNRSERDVVKLIAGKVSLEQIMTRMGLSERSVQGLVHNARFAFGANDDLVDDYLNLLTDWQAETGHDFGVQKVEEPKPDAERLAILEEIEKNLDPNEMRDVARSLLRLADAIDQEWSPNDNRLAYHWPSGAARIERNALELAKRAVMLLEQRKLRDKYLPSGLFGDPAWYMLLDLFVQFAGGAKVSITSLSIAAYCPTTTALRHIGQLEEQGLIVREASPTDARVKLLSLTKQGVLGVGRVLERVAV